MGLFNLYKPKEYKYRYIYYDPKKEASKEREKKWRKVKPTQMALINQQFSSGELFATKWQIK